MRIGNFLKIGDTIGLVAPSFGANIEPYSTRLKAAISFLEKTGFKIKVFGDLFSYEKGASADKQTRANHFMDCYLDSDVKAVWSVSGGELMMEILPFLDFVKLKAAPAKLFIGYSDNTNLTFLLPTLLNFISIYAPCLSSFGMNPLDPFLKNTLNLLKGEKIIQHASLFHEPRETKDDNPLAPYQLTVPTKWINLNGEKEIALQGRLIGGCLDVLVSLVGTKYDQVKLFIEKYQDDNIIWFLEAADLNIFAYKRALWQLKEAGWFNKAKGILIGRSNSIEPFIDLDIYNVTKDVLSSLNIPIIIDLDIGHTKPMVTLFTGDIIKVINNKRKSYITF